MKLTDCDLSKPFAHPDMIGAYCLYDGKHWVHRDNPEDFKDEAFIREHCIPSNNIALRYMEPGWVTRGDWYNL